MKKCIIVWSFFICSLLPAMKEAQQVPSQKINAFYVKIDSKAADYMKLLLNSKNLHSKKCLERQHSKVKFPPPARKELQAYIDAYSEENVKNGNFDSYSIREVNIEWSNSWYRFCLIKRFTAVPCGLPDAEKLKKILLTVPRYLEVKTPDEFYALRRQWEEEARNYLDNMQ